MLGEVAGRKGYAVDEGESDEQICGVADQVFDFGRDVIAHPSA